MRTLASICVQKHFSYVRRGHILPKNLLQSLKKIFKRQIQRQKQAGLWESRGFAVEENFRPLFLAITRQLFVNFTALISSTRVVKKGHMNWQKLISSSSGVVYGIVGSLWISSLPGLNRYIKPTVPSVFNSDVKKRRTPSSRQCKTPRRFRYSRKNNRAKMVGSFTSSAQSGHRSIRLPFVPLDGAFLAQKNLKKKKCQSK